MKFRIHDPSARPSCWWPWALDFVSSTRPSPSQTGQQLTDCHYQTLYRINLSKFSNDTISWSPCPCSLIYCCIAKPFEVSKTRKLCCRKDARALRPIHGCHENFRDSLTTLTTTIPNIFHGLLFRSTLWMFLQNFKSVALPVPEIIRRTQKIWAVPGYAHAPFSPKFLMDFYSDWPCKCTRQIWSP